MNKRYHHSWDPILKPLFQESYMYALHDFVQEERNSYTVFPDQEMVFNAMQLTPFDGVKVVILGQDPYHNEGQAQGLSFSVPAGTPLPPSLKNIFAELATDIAGFEAPIAGDLSYWATQGVLLLNATLTVRAHTPGSHQKKGWERFTDHIISAIAEGRDHVVFILWGAYAHKKAALIDERKHLILKAVHPSPLSVYRGFYGSKPFSQTNNYLINNGMKPIDWHLSVQ